MMTRQELHGSWDQPTSTIVIRNVEASRLQQLAGQVAERAMTLVELNERALALRSGSLRADDDDDNFRGRRREWGDDGGFKGRRPGGGRGRGRGDYGGDRRRRDGGDRRRRDGGGYGGRRDRYDRGGMESLGHLGGGGGGYRPRPGRGF